MIIALQTTINDPLTCTAFRPSPPLRLYTGSDTSSVEVGGLATLDVM